MTLAALSILPLAASAGRGATGHHTGLYIGATVVIVVVFLVAALLRNRRRSASR